MLKMYVLIVGICIYVLALPLGDAKEACVT